MRTLVLVLALLAPTLALADPALDTFLEQRVPAELAADGVVLARHGVELDVESVGDQLIISLIDPATRRAVASTKLDTVPADREAAVASVSQVASNLIAQQLDRDGVDRDRREAAETAYRKEALSFGDALLSKEGTQVYWTAYQGDLHRRLDYEDFYRVVGRPDLAAHLRQHVRRSKVAFLGGTGLMLAGGLLAISVAASHHCDVFKPDYDSCQNAEDHRAVMGGVIGGGIMLTGLVLAVVGLQQLATAQPVSETEAHALAERYNLDLRRRHGLPTARRELRLAPYAVADGGGLVLGGRF